MLEDSHMNLSPDSPPPAVLCDGFGRFINFLLEAEAEYLCGAALYERSTQRTNRRSGFHTRKVRTSLGDIQACMIHFKHMHPRASIVKRAKRISPLIFETLARIHAAGVTGNEASALVKMLWTMDLPDRLLASLSKKLVPILEKWRDAAITAQGAAGK